jgi:hypothetical protein
MSCLKSLITLILINQFILTKGSILIHKIKSSEKNSLEEINQKVLNNKLVSINIDFSDIESKINKTIDEKFDQLMNKLNEIGN